MTSKRLYYILVATVFLLLAGTLGGAYGAVAILTQQSSDLLAARSKSAALEQQQTQLATAKGSIAKYQAIGDIARSIVPQDKDQAQTVREIVKIAADNGVKLGGITFPTSTLGGATGSTSASSAASSSSSSSAKPAANAKAAKLSQLKPASGLNGVYTLQINVQSDPNNSPTYNQFVGFLAALENNRRTALVSAISLQPDTKDPSAVSFTLGIDEYIKP